MNDPYYWTISGLKNIGGMNSKRNYWKCVLAALLITLSTGSAGSGSSSIVNSLSENENYSGIFSHGAEMFSWSTVGLGAIAAIFFGASIVALIVGIFLLYPLEVGARRFFITNRVSNAQIDQVGIAFSSNYLNIVKTQFLRYLFTYLWSLLFLVPGIIKSYEYRMIPYILAENPSINWREAFRLSKAMMDGQKWNAFVLDLSFIGWHILSAFTFGLLDLFYTNPYQQQTNAELYDVLKSRLFGTQRQNYGGNGYGPNGGYNGGNGYGPNGGYYGGNGYGPNGGYNGGNGYGPNGGYNGGNGYGPNGGYNGGNGYGPNGGYNADWGQSQNDAANNTGYSKGQPTGYNPDASGRTESTDGQPKGYRPDDGTATGQNNQ